MYRGFNIKNPSSISEYYSKGLTIYNDQVRSIHGVLDKYIRADGSIDGSALQDDWFPQLKFDIFISHSHQDRDKAISLAGMLNTIGLTAFVDSSIWGYADDLLRKIDEIKCYSSETHTFDYQLRNATTSHVHMMLSNALYRMIDRTECLFFLNSPQSVKLDSVIDKTLSAWIYAEIGISQVIRKQVPNRKLVKSETKTFNNRGAANESIAVDYNINLSHLTDITYGEISKWITEYSSDDHKLDTLYKLKPLTNMLL